MQFHREIFLNTPEDCEWLRTTHLKAIGFPAFESFTLAGNEDSPHSVELYARRKPEYNEQPVATYTQGDEGDLVGPPRVAVKRRSTLKGK